MISIKDNLLRTGIFEDNIYLNLYVELIKDNRIRRREKFKTATHHIIPKAYFRKSNKQIDNSEDNLVNLLHKDHALAHYYLALCTKDKYFLYSSVSALQHIIGFNKKMNQEDIQTFIDNLDEYQYLIEEKNKYHSCYMKSRLCGDKNPSKRPDVREKIRLSKLGNTNTLGKHIHNDIWKEKQRERRKNLISITDGKHQKFVDKDSLQYYFDLG